MTSSFIAVVCLLNNRDKDIRPTDNNVHKIKKKIMDAVYYTSLPPDLCRTDRPYNSDVTD